MKSIKENFLDDVKNHKMSVMLNNGLHRHLRFRTNNSFIHSFDVVTYPHHLVISGDMGTYVFSRLEDMFEFFHYDREPNFHYWAEKLKAGIHEEYSEEKLRKNVNYHLDEFLSYNNDITEDDKNQILSDVEDLLNGQDHTFEHVVINELMDFHSLGYNIFEDFYQYDNNELTYHYQWCCYAIQHAIKEFSNMENKQNAN